MSDTWDLIRPSFLFLIDNKREGLIRGCEVGVYEGKNAVTMLNYCPRLFLELIDILAQPSIIEKYCIDGRARFHHTLSIEVAKTFPNEYFDYVYIDGAHDYKNVWQDLNAWYPKVKMGGIFAGHDWWFEDVNRAVLDFFAEYPQRLYAVSHYYNAVIPSHDAQMMDWWLRKG